MSARPLRGLVRFLPLRSRPATYDEALPEATASVVPATGDVGSALLDNLANANVEVRALVRGRRLTGHHANSYKEFAADFELLFRGW